jgi:hypothetical protein
VPELATEPRRRDASGLRVTTTRGDATERSDHAKGRPLHDATGSHCLAHTKLLTSRGSVVWYAGS